MRTLVVAVNLPYPCFGGMDLRNWQNVNGLAAIGEVGIFGLCSNDPRAVMRPPLTLSFQRCTTDHTLSNPPPKGIKVDARGWHTKPLGHPSDYLYSDKAANELSTLLWAFQPQAVLLEGIWPHRYIDILKRHSCRIILDGHNVEAKVAEQIARSVSGNDPGAKLRRLVIPDRVRAIEHASMTRVDQIWVCSEADESLMKTLYGPASDIFVVPNSINVNHYRDVQLRHNREHGDRKKTIIFTGTFAYEPNANAARFLIDRIFPRLCDDCPDLELYLVGAHPTPEMLAAAERERRIIVTGAVADVRPYLAESSLMLVPLFEGSGTRFKILEAFAARLPVISTAQGAEGLVVSQGTHLLFAEDEDAFVAAVHLLWENDRLANNLSDNALELVQRRYSWKAAHDLIKVALERLNDSFLNKTLTVI